MRVSVCLSLLILVITGCREDRGVSSKEDRSYDEGPHIVLNGDSAQVLYFIQNDRIWTIRKTETEQINNKEVAVGNPLKEPFVVKIGPHPLDASSEYPSAFSITVVSDIEGNYVALYSLLTAHNIIDQDGHWTYDDGHLVMLGDLFDRGPDVTPTLWLLYKLESEARKVGGYVHVLLGNHELMIFDGDTRYINAKYTAQSKDIGQSYAFLYSPQTVLGKWIRSKPAMIKIGDVLFSHAGVSPDVMDLNLGLDEINDLVINRNSSLTDGSGLAIKTVFGKKGIFWYRGWVEHPPSEQVLDDILEGYGVHYMVIGHTVVPEIRAAYHYKIITTDVKRSRDPDQSPVKALLIEGKVFYEINSRGERRPIISG